MVISSQESTGSNKQIKKHPLPCASRLQQRHLHPLLGCSSFASPADAETYKWELIMPISLCFSGSGISTTTTLRLVGGLNKCIGRVEMFYNNEWGTVCDDSWDMSDAMVVCRQLGCGTALSAPGSARFGWGSGRIWLDEVNCTGEENDISQCKAKTWGVHNCHHGEDAGVVCSGETWAGVGRRQAYGWTCDQSSCTPGTESRACKKDGERYFTRVLSNLLH